MGGPNRQSLEEKFERHVVRADGCWSWKGSKHQFGYGWIRHGNKTLIAHRVSYALHKGEIPDGMLVMHTCDNPECTNPDHLVLGTDADNQADKVSKGRQYSGERHHLYGKRSPRAILSDEDFNTVRLMYADGVCRPKIASAFGVAYHVVRRATQSAEGGVTTCR